MPERDAELRAAEEGLRSIERLLGRGDSAAAELALEMMAPGLESLVDNEEAARLRRVRSALAEQGATVAARPR